MKSFNEFNESVRDLLTGKSKDEINNALKDLDIDNNISVKIFNPYGYRLVDGDIIKQERYNDQYAKLTGSFIDIYDYMEKYYNTIGYTATIDKIKHSLINENNSEDDVVSFLKKQMEEDKNDYVGDILTEYKPSSGWGDRIWIIDEILQFLNNTHTSYVISKFGKKYDYKTLDNILKKNFKSEYLYSLKIKTTHEN